MHRPIYSLGYPRKKRRARRRLVTRFVGGLVGVAIVSAVAVTLRFGTNYHIGKPAPVAPNRVLSQTPGSQSETGTRLPGNDSGAAAVTPPVSKVPKKPVHVMIVGGSIAKGEHAPNDFGYLQRTFHSLTTRTQTKYVYTDKAIVGANSTQLATLYKGSYESWLESVHPQIVVISWGLLNDALPNTPMTTFKHYLNKEIDEALNHHAVVMIVTPPVTKATYTKFPRREQSYALGEIQLVKSLNNPKVYVFNLFDQMKHYLSSHHQTYVPYTADPNHPNVAGHILAGRLLYKDIVHQFGRRPIAQ